VTGEKAGMARRIERFRKRAPADGRARHMLPLGKDRFREQGPPGSCKNLRKLRRKITSFHVLLIPKFNST
jgi:hypothetical protein